MGADGYENILKLCTEFELAAPIKIVDGRAFLTLEHLEEIGAGFHTFHGLEDLFQELENRGLVEDFEAPAHNSSCRRTIHHLLADYIKADGYSEAPKIVVSMNKGVLDEIEQGLTPTER